MGLGGEDFVLVLPGGHVSREALMDALAALAHGGPSVRSARDAK